MISSTTVGDLYYFSDNARYYKSEIIQEALKTEKYKQIKMIFIPAYLPNLNQICKCGFRFTPRKSMEVFQKRGIRKSVL